MTLDSVSDIETLRTAAKLLDAENRKLVSEVTRLQRELSELRGDNPEQLMMQIAELQQRVDAMQRKIFGASTEKRPSCKAKADKPAAPQRGHGPRPQPKLAIV